jgi:hypothetical protein
MTWTEYEFKVSHKSDWKNNKLRSYSELYTSLSEAMF